MNYPRKITAVKKLLPAILYIPLERYEDFIGDQKKRMVCDLMDEYPENRYELVCFDVEGSDAELFEAIEHNFKGRDGRYHYDGNFVSREFLEKKFENIPCQIRLTAYALGDHKGERK